MDDSTIIQIYPYNNIPTKEKMKLAQEGLDMFSGAAQSMGGQVSTAKDKWYLLEFKWDKVGKWRQDDNEAYLFIQTPTGPQKVERLPPSGA